MKNEAQRGGASCPRSHSWCVAKPKATRRHVAACRVLAPPPHSLVLVTGASESAATPLHEGRPPAPGRKSRSRRKGAAWARTQPKSVYGCRWCRRERDDGRGEAWGLSRHLPRLWNSTQRPAERGSRETPVSFSLFCREEWGRRTRCWTSAPGWPRSGVTAPALPSPATGGS